MSESKDFIVLGFESCFDVGLTDDATDFGLELINFATISLKTVGGIIVKLLRPSHRQIMGTVPVFETVPEVTGVKHERVFPRF